VESHLLPERMPTEPPAAPRPADFERGLARLGYEQFRPGQEAAVETLLREGRLLFVAPTGGGKSLVYQLPAVLLPGTTLVVSPLVSLMRDQVEALRERGVEAAYLASTLPPEVLRRTQREAASGRFDLLYAAPERLTFEGFRALLRDIDCPLVAIDEAHCISEWGHDFRPEYLQLDALLASLPKARVLACTATATPVVRDEIVARLGLPADTPQLVRGFARPNLSLRVAECESRSERTSRVDDALREALTAPGAAEGAAIVYAPTRRAAEQEALRLERAGWRADFYHAGLEGAARDATHQRFSAGELEVVVATNAFGMGIDRADVRAVVHLAPPGSIEAYYQEVGRAGRDGRDALGLLLISPADWPRRRALLEADGAAGASGIAHKWGLFLELMRFAEGGSCRHDAILRYFGDEAETLSGCGRCDVCRALDDPSDAGDPEEVSLIVRKALSGVARVHGRYGLSAAVALLRGARDERLARDHLDTTRTYGVLSEHGDRFLQRLLRRCVTTGWVDFEGGDRPVVVLTETGRQAMHGEVPIRLRLPAGAPAASRSPRPRSPQAASDEAPLEADAQPVFEALRAHRVERARRDGVPPYVIASDRTLRDLARQRPRDEDGLRDVHGVGPAKVRRYGADWLAILRAGTADPAAGSEPG